MNTGRRENRCAWVIPPDEPKARVLVPGCMERVQDWDAACTCPTSAEELDALDQCITYLEEALRFEEDYASGLSRRLYAQDGGAALVAAARSDATERARLRAVVAAENERDRAAGRRA